MGGNEPPHGKMRQPNRVCLQALVGKAPVRLQNGRAPALLRSPIWQSPGREAALPWASIAETCLASGVTAQERAGCTRLGDATGAFLASARLLPCLSTLGPRATLGGLRGRWLAHCQGLQQ